MRSHPACRSYLPVALSLAVASLAVSCGGTRPAVQSTPAAADTAVVRHGGFERAVAVIPSVGLWADGLAELGISRKPGLELWWGLEAPAAPGSGRTLDWKRVSFRVRATISTSTGREVARRDEIIEPLRLDGAYESDGFPMVMHVPLAPGDYRVQLEAYPLMSAKDAGLDSVPRGVVLAEAHVPAVAGGVDGWRLGDVHIFRAVRRWEPGAPPERTWYEWIISPIVSRTIPSDLAKAYLAFELSRDADVVPRCANNSCRVVITVRDAEGGVRLQDLRMVPESAAVTAYLAPIEAGQLAAGEHEALVEIYVSRTVQVALRRKFEVSAR
jgi:hypothetical protein